MHSRLQRDVPVLLLSFLVRFLRRALGQARTQLLPPVVRCVAFSPAIVAFGHFLIPNS